MNDSEKLHECLKAMRYAIELIRNAHFIAAWIPSADRMFT